MPRLKKGKRKTRSGKEKGKVHRRCLEEEKSGLSAMRREKVGTESPRAVYRHEREKKE